MSPCGLYVEAVQMPEDLKQIQFVPISDGAGRRMVGLRITYLSFALIPLILLFDPEQTYSPIVRASWIYRPSCLIVRNARRTQTVMRTWPPTTSTQHRIVQVTF